MIGAYLAFVLAPWFGDWYLTKLLAGVILARLFGYLLEWPSSASSTSVTTCSRC